MLETYGPVIGAAILMLIIVYARHLQTKQQEEQTMDWLTIVEKIAPVVLALIPGIPAKLVPIIIDGIAAAEKAGGTGREKLAAVVVNASQAAPTIEVPRIADAVKAVITAANSTQEAAK